jgi:hypothetical protein
MRVGSEGFMRGFPIDPAARALAVNDVNQASNDDLNAVAPRIGEKRTGKMGSI